MLLRRGAGWDGDIEGEAGLGLEGGGERLVKVTGPCRSLGGSWVSHAGCSVQKRPRMFCPPVAGRPAQGLRTSLHTLPSQEIPGSFFRPLDPGGELQESVARFAGVSGDPGALYMARCSQGQLQAFPKEHQVLSETHEPPTKDQNCGDFLAWRFSHPAAHLVT